MSRPAPASDEQHELIVIVPVCNEDAALDGRLMEWSGALRRHGIRYQIQVFDDGSDPDVADRLDSLSPGIDHLSVVHHSNMGHGPTLVRAYRQATGPWILQIDGDDAVGPAAFPALWDRRHQYDLLLGVRRGREAPVVRRFVTWCARNSVRLAFGAQFQDVNAPFRLMRRSAFAPLFGQLPADTFAPNVALTGMAARARLRVLELPVACARSTGRPSSLRSFGLLRAVVKSGLQTAALGVLVHRGRQPGDRKRGRRE